MKKLLTLLLLFQIHASIAQEAYVTAKNGLIVRSEPNKTSNRIGKLDYATKITSFYTTHQKEEVINDGAVVSGEWYHIDFNGRAGYVFSGFLDMSITINFEAFSVQLEYIPLLEGKSIPEKVQKDTVKLVCDLAGSPEYKTVKIKNNSFKKVEVYQRFQNSITIMDEGPHCDLIDWKHYYSNWEHIPFDEEKNEFTTLAYCNADSDKFIPFKIDELKKAVEEHCSTRWSNLITITENTIAYPIGVATSKIYIKIIVTDQNDTVSEKIIEFIIPMGC